MNFHVRQRGQMLIEVLIAIGIVAVTALIVAVALQAGPKTVETANVRTRAFELAAEAQEIVRDIAAKNWNKICDSAYTSCELTSGATYHSEVDPTTTEWMLVSGSETKTLANTNYTRSVVIDNVCRDEIGAIVPGGGGGGAGPPMDPNDALVLNNFTGFETGGLDEAKATVNSPVVQDVTTRSGTYALGLDPNDQYDIEPFQDGGDQGNDYIVGFAFRPTLFASAARNFFQVREGTAEIDTVLTLQLVGTDGDFRVVSTTEEIAKVSGVFTLNEWHFIEIHWQHSDLGAIDIYVDGVSRVSSTGKDMSRGGIFNNYVLVNTSPSLYYFDDFYAYSGASGTDDFLGDAEVFRYQAYMAPTPPILNSDFGDDINLGPWYNAGCTPVSDTSYVAYTEDNTAQSGGVWTDDPQLDLCYRHGPHDDSEITGTIHGGKWISRLGEFDSGSTGVYHVRYGNDGATPLSRTVTLTSGSYKKFFVISEDPNVVPTSDQHFAYGFGKNADGKRDIRATSFWSMLLHRPSSGPVISCDDDPSTRKVTVTVSAKGLNPINLVTYLTRWGKKDTGQTNPQNCATFQTDWSGGVTTTSTVVTGSCLSASNLGTYLMNPLSDPVAAPPESSMEYTKVTGSLYMEPQP